jgi:hypothetical protein
MKRQVVYSKADGDNTKALCERIWGPAVTFELKKGARSGPRAKVTAMVQVGG